MNSKSSRAAGPGWLVLFPVLGMLLLLVLLTLPGCGRSGGEGKPKRAFLSLGTAPVGGAFQVVGNALSEVLNESKGDNNWRVQAKGTKGSQENIRRLSRGELQLAMSNAAITYFAVRGEAGWEKAYDMRAVMTLAPNVALFITTQDSGVKTIADLKGKRVVIGPAGAGFEMFVDPVVREHGVTFDDFTPLNDTQSGAVEMLGDGSAQAAFLGGAVPTGSITQACSTYNIHFVPFDEQARQRLVEKYPFFHPVTIEQGTYSGMSEDYQGLNVGSMRLITSADQDEELIYQITKTLWEKRAEIAQKHPAGRAINEQNAARYTGTEFHPGAIRFYQEIGIWPESASPQAAAGELEQAAASEE